MWFTLYRVKEINPTMISEKQLAANRRNAQRSTGPKTDEGKKVADLNARRHNLTGQVTAMTDADRIMHDAFSAAMVESLRTISAPLLAGQDYRRDLRVVSGNREGLTERHAT